MEKAVSHFIGAKPLFSLKITILLPVSNDVSPARLRLPLVAVLPFIREQMLLDGRNDAAVGDDAASLRIPAGTEAAAGPYPFGAAPGTNIPARRAPAVPCGGSQPHKYCVCLDMPFMFPFNEKSRGSNENITAAAAFCA